MARHPISLMLERAAVQLKETSAEVEPITEADARDILQDACRVLAGLIDTLEVYEEETGEHTGVVADLADALDRLESHLSA